VSSRAEVERLIHWMPIIVRSHRLTDWERQFCASIVSRSRAGRFEPTARQVGIMAEIERKFRAASRDARAAPSPDVIE
jgi:hypothetical protein